MLPVLAVALLVLAASVSAAPLVWLQTASAAIPDDLLQVAGTQEIGETRIKVGFRIEVGLMAGWVILKAVVCSKCT